MTLANRSICRLTRAGLQSVVALGLFCASFGVAQTSPEIAVHDPDVIGSTMKSLLAAQQEALDSGDPDRILKDSEPVAAASLALLNSLDAQDQENRKALEALPYAEELLSDLPAELSLLRMELSLGETDHAAELKKHILSTNPESAELHMKLAEILEQGSAWGEAVGEAQRAVELDSTSRQAQIGLGVAYWGLNLFRYNEDTLRAFAAARSLDPSGFSSNLSLGLIESQYQRFEDAAPHLRAAIAADPSAPEPWYQLGLNAYEQGRTAEAGELLEHYVSLAGTGKNADPSQMRLALLTLDQIAAEQGKAPDPAHRAQEGALKQRILGTEAVSSAGDRSPLPDGTGATEGKAATTAHLREMAASALENIGAVLARRQDFAAAVVPFRYAAEEEPALKNATRELGLAAYYAGAYTESAQALKQVVAAHPEYAAERAYLGVAEFKSGDYSGAAATFSSFGSVLSSKPLFAATAAAAFARTGDRDRAAQTIGALKGADADPRLQAREAIVYLDLGDADRAADLAKSALSGSAEPPAEALRVLGLLDLEGGDASKAETEFQKEAKGGREGTEDRIESQALMAEALMESGKTSEGEDLGLKLTQASPNLAKTFLHECQLLLRNGDAQAAYQKCAAAVALDPGGKEIRPAFDSAKRALRIPAGTPPR